MAVVVAALVIGFASCGGDDRTSSGTATGQFAKQAEAICERTQTRIVKLMRRGGEHRGELALARRQALMTYRRQVVELEALNPPSKLADSYTRYKATLVSLQRGLAVRLEEAKTLEKQEVHDPTSKDHALAEREQALQRKATSIADDLRLHACN